MRIDLARYHCVHLHILSRFEISEEKDIEVRSFLNRTPTHSHNYSSQRSLSSFGARSRVKGATYKVQGSLRRFSSSDRRYIQLRIISDKTTESLPRPPIEYKPVSKLMEALPDLFGPVKVTCGCTFEYGEAHRSRIRFPMPLLVPARDNGVTHIESARFSRRTSDGLDYRISVIPDEDEDSLTHVVSFQADISLTWKSIRQLFVRARSISLGLLETAKGD